MSQKRDVNDNFIITAKRVSFVSIIVNVLLSFGKLLAGILGNSKAMISDAVHSFSDVFSTIIVIIGLHFSAKKEDDDHPYGHERLECVAAIVLANILLVTGIFIGYSGVCSIINMDYENKAMPGIVAICAAITSIIVKEFMYHYTKHHARVIGSSALLADAWHHRSDALSSIGSFVGILFARMGYPIMDPIAGIVICLFIIKAAIDIFRDAINRMVDKACPDEFVDQVTALVQSDPDVIGIDFLKTRLFGNRIYIDLEIKVDENLSLKAAHDIAERVHDNVEKEFDNVKHIMIHVNP